MVDILDSRGQPIPKAPKLEQQTARVGHLHREFAEHPSRGLTPAKLARILEDAEQGNLVAQAQLGEDMEEKDAHLFAELSKRRRAILGLNWDLRPPEDATDQEREWTRRVENMIRVLDWETIVYDASAAILHGYACQEYNWDRSEGQWHLAAVDYRQPDWFMCPLEDRNQLRLRSTDGQGEPLRPLGWLVHTHKAKSGYLARGGLARILAWPYLFRNFSARDFAEFLEIYGLPLRLGKYQPGASDAEKATLMRAVVNIGHAAAGIVPHGMEMEFKEAAKGASDPFMAMVHWAESSVSKAILGGTLTSQTSASGGGAYALGQVHNEVRHDILISDAKQLARSLSQYLVAPLARLNTPLRRMPQWMFETEQPEDISQYAESLPKLAEAGLRIPLKWAHQKLGIPEPEDGEAVLGSQAEQTPAAVRTAALRTAPNAGPASFEDQDALDDALTALSEGDLDSQMIGLLQPIMAAAAEGPEALRDRLDELWPEMDDEQLQERLHRAAFVAELWGQIHGG
ncbi:MAG: DUF935 domain-containing protein [Marinobacter sp.]|uniref:DUF935 domain-containing protein n=1 Tax=Marinobacter sp. TaxID=50741 RepID=UPI00299DAEB0|nr:DUF935 domain-containing protein [Marinobacter sp.]MDX1755876.1 DUF935 domain-containing protein [Marinobacter sp.]